MDTRLREEEGGQVDTMEIVGISIEVENISVACAAAGRSGR